MIGVKRWTRGRFMPQAVAEIAFSLIVSGTLLTFCVMAEVLSAREPISWKHRLSQSGYLILSQVSTFAAAYYLGQVWSGFGVEPLLRLSDWPFWAGQIAAVLVYDFLRYIDHRFQHRFLWPVHSVHHTQTSLHALSSYIHPLAAVGELFCIVIPLSLIQITPEVGFYAAMVMTLHNFFNHSPTRVHLGPLRRVFSDCRYHRVHHSIEERHFGKNFGIMFSLWDQIFGTAYFPTPDEWPATGVKGHAPPKSVTDFFTRPFQMWAVQVRDDARRWTGHHSAQRQMVSSTHATALGDVNENDGSNISIEQDASRAHRLC